MSIEKQNIVSKIKSKFGLSKKESVVALLLLLGISGTGLYLANRIFKNKHKSEISNSDSKLIQKLNQNYEKARPEGDDYKNIQMFLDYSHHQDNISIKKQNLSPWFFIAKATQTEMTKTGGVDLSFAKLRQDVNNKPIGGYMFLDWRRDDIQKQCDLYTNVVSLKKGDFRPIIDFEQNGHLIGNNKRYISNRIKAMESLNQAIQIIKNHYGVYPIIYLPEKLYKDFVKGNINIDCPIWIANYNGKMDKSLEEVDMRQCSQHYKVDIYNKESKNTDVNVILKKRTPCRIYMPHDVGLLPQIDILPNIVEKPQIETVKPKELPVKIEEKVKPKVPKASEKPKKEVSQNNIKIIEKNTSFVVYQYTIQSDNSEIGAVKNRIKSHFKIKSDIKNMKLVGKKGNIYKEKIAKKKYNKGEMVYIQIKK